MLEAPTPEAPMPRRLAVMQRARHVRERLRSQRVRAPSLDALNFLVADVRGALGPYVIVYLVADHHWSVGTVGLVATLGGWLTLLTQTPLGTVLDTTSRKRGLLLVALLILGIGAAAITLWPEFWPVLIANAGMQIVSGIFDPAIAALTVGLFTREALTRRMGRNAAFARLGNLTVAGMAAALGWLFSPRAVFLQVPFFATAAALAVLTIPHHKIDLRRARGLKAEETESAPANWKVLLTSRPLLIFGLCSLLFEFAAAPLVTLVGQKLAVTGLGSSSLMTSACVMASQAGMLPAAMAVGWKADEWGHRRLLLVGFAILPRQAVLTTFRGDLACLLPLQFVGGVGTGLFSALTPLLLADAMHGTGRYNTSQGAVATLCSLGVASSGIAAEFIVGRFGYNAAFLGCGAVATMALALLWFGMPETVQQPEKASAAAHATG
jgi:MFS family permease